MGIISNFKAAVAGAVTGFRLAYGSSFTEATKFSPDRSANTVVWLDPDTRNYLDSWTRVEILRKVEWLFQNFGVIKEAVRGIARLTVGRGICLTLNTDDEEWNALAETDFDAWACAPNRCDLAGRRTLYEMQAHAVQMRIKAGEFLAAFAENPRWEGEPCLQLFDSLEIESPGDGQGDAYTVDGVRMDANHCPVEYFARGIDGKHKGIPASEMIHWYHADATNQVRGVSELAQAVAPMADAKELAKIVTKTAKQNSALGLHIKRIAKEGGDGALDRIRSLSQRANVQKGLPPGSSSTAPGTDRNPMYERLIGGGAIIYTDDQGDVKFLTPNSPSPLVEPFIKKVLIRDGLGSTGVPAELFWDCTELNSANQRFILVKGEAVFTTLGDSCTERLCNPAAVRFILHRIKTGKLRRPHIRVLTPIARTVTVPADGVADPLLEAGEEFAESWIEDTENRWMSCLAWQLPARLSIDNSRDAAAEISQLDNNIETLSSIHDRRGRGWRNMVDQWFRECAYAARSAVKHKAKWALSLWRRGAPGSQGGPTQPTEEPEDKKPEEKPGES